MSVSLISTSSLLSSEYWDFLRVLGPLFSLSTFLISHFLQIHGFSFCVYIDNTQIFISKPDLFEDQNNFSTDYLTSPFRCLRDISNSTFLKLNSWSSPYKRTLQYFICGNHLISYKSQKPRNQSFYCNRFLSCLQIYFAYIPWKNIFKNYISPHWSKFLIDRFFFLVWGRGKPVILFHSTAS